MDEVGGTAKGAYNGLDGDYTGLGFFENHNVNISEKGLDIVKTHLDNFGYMPENAAMINRLEKSLLKGKSLSGADASFYMHEVAESTMMKKLIADGMEFSDAYKMAHSAALKKYKVSPFSVYHPDVIKLLPDEFNSMWKKFWGIK